MRKSRNFSILWPFIWQVEPAGDPWRGCNGRRRRPWRCCGRGRGSTGRFEAPPRKGTHRKPGKDFCMCQSLYWHQEAGNFQGGQNCINFQSVPMKRQIVGLFQHCKHIAPLLAAPAALLLVQGQAKAVLTYNIFESAGAVIVQTSGSLDLTGATLLGTNTSCGVNGAILSSDATICTGFDIGDIPAYVISGPTSFVGTASLFPASTVSGINTAFTGRGSVFIIDPTYNFSDSIVSSATFNGTTLASLGFTTSGLIGTWSFTGTSETIQVVLGNPPAAAVPGPLPLLGIGAAFGWSRRLRKRIAAPLITPPQA